MSDFIRSEWRVPRWSRHAAAGRWMRSECAACGQFAQSNIDKIVRLGRFRGRVERDESRIHSWETQHSHHPQT